MLNGNRFAKKFGGASGTDPDWFMLTITGKNASGDMTGSFDFYLADFRDADSANHYIVNNWIPVAFTALGNNVKTLEFSPDFFRHGNFWHKHPHVLRHG